ncbi:MAG TPA: response regulator [Pseudomonadota bacterium]|jgi:two-component system chemotaxis sensor kinase CheA|nr:response regulator [Pseudomonadota bacterium]HNN50049.1 response regulator [Pseudomonadota bacterium]
MDKSVLIQRLLETFLVEFDERLQAMSRGLLALEASATGTPERDKNLQELLRNAHSLKGAARAVEVSLIEKSCHHLEEILAAVRNHPTLLDQHLIQLLFGVLDGLAEAGKLLRKQEPLEGSLLFGVALEMEMFIESTIRPLGKEPAQALAAPPPAQIAKSDPNADAENAVSSDLPTVRIHTEKLDALLTRSGELLTARQHLRLTSEQLSQVADSIRRLESEWRHHGKENAKIGSPTSKTATKIGDSLVEETPARLTELVAQIDKLQLALRQDLRQLEHTGSALDQQVSRIRMLPFSHACVGFDRMVRDLARNSGKDIELRIEGGDVELDRSVLDALKDPLRHLIRNSIDHGIERPEDRKRSKKSPRGTIIASATLRGGQVAIVISDDGQGLVADSIRKRAQKLGMPIPDTDQKLIDAIFMPGFSTAADSVSMVSGRGIGLDVVRNQIKSLHGEVDVSFVPGKGTQFQLTVPLTLTLLRVLLIRAADQTFVVSNNYVHKLLRLRQNEVIWIGERPMIVIDNQPIHLDSFAHALSLRQPTGITWQGKRPVVVLRSEQRTAAFLVDELVAEQEVTVKSLGSRVKRIRNVAGAVIMPDGQVALTIHVADLLHTEKPDESLGALRHGGAQDSGERKQRRILVVDDSVTTRSLERSLLESAGFSVELAADGVQAWDRIQSGEIDLVLSDVDMPLLNGYQLTQTIRKSELFRKLPVILITSNDDQRSRERGIEAGASAYMTKGTFDQSVLLSVIEQLI